MTDEQKPYRLTRRNFLGTGAAAGVVAPVATAFIAPGAEGAATPSPSPHGEDYLTAAQQAARWIRSAQVPKEVGIGWLPDPDHPDKQ